MFQSSPAPRRGRYMAVTADIKISKPMVSILARAEARALLPCALRLCRPCRVSILARAEARALLQKVGQPRGVKNVSILARAEARALLLPRASRAIRRVVSILARAEARALQPIRLTCTLFGSFQSSPAPRRGRYPPDVAAGAPVVVFQSSPAPRRGRYMARASVSACGSWFQSSPAPRRGRYLAVPLWELAPVIVSILARAEARALLKVYDASNVVRVFQSSPAPRRGRYPVGTEQRGSVTSVSILARAEARALQHVLHAAQGHFNVSILARAEARALLRNGARLCRHWMFQSSPAPRRGRYAGCGLCPSPPARFNPRPRRGAGATTAASVPEPVYCSFNPRPRRGAGATFQRRPHDHRAGVSILARAEARALLALHAARR